MTRRSAIPHGLPAACACFAPGPPARNAPRPKGPWQKWGTREAPAWRGPIDGHCRLRHQTALEVGQGNPSAAPRQESSVAKTYPCSGSGRVYRVPAAVNGQEGSEWLGRILRGLPHGVPIEAMEAASWLRLRTTGQRPLPAKPTQETRSEERRVGKECR